MFFLQNLCVCRCVSLGVTETVCLSLQVIGSVGLQLNYTIPAEKRKAERGEEG